MVDFDRLYELKNLSGNNEEYKNCYFYDLEYLLKNHNVYYASLVKGLNRLDDKSWEFFKNECLAELCLYDKDRGWTQLFNKFNEVKKGYCHLLDKGCNAVQFIPCSNKKGIKMPDLFGLYDESKFLCEVKTINQSDIERERRQNIEYKEVMYELNDGLRSQVKKVVANAKAQLNAYSCENIKGKIIYLIVDNDDWQPEVIPIIRDKIQCYSNTLAGHEIEIVVNVT